MLKYKKIALFNHKGGVSKTTTVFNLGWILAQKGKRIIMVDADSQCNLTGMVVGFEELEALYQSNNNIKDALSSAFESKPIPIEAVECFKIKEIDNLYLLPGNIKFAEYDITLGMAHNMSESFITLQNLPGAINELLDKTAQKYNADYILIDMSPSLSSINQNLFMISDYFIIPTTPDYFSIMALESLSNILPKWYKQSKKLQNNEILEEAVYKFPKKTPKFLGNIIQKFNVRKDRPTQGFKKWFEEINKFTREKFIPKMREKNMLLNLNCYKENYILAEIADFQSLIAYAQEHNKPIFALDRNDVRQSGTVWASSKNNIQKFKEIFSNIADDIIKITNEKC